MGLRLKAAWIVCLLAAGCVKPDSQVASEEIPQTGVEDQGWVGFCWAYTTMAFLESEYKIRTGRDLNLSEEALGFHRMAEELFWMAHNEPKDKLKPELLNESSFEWAEGWHFMWAPDYGPQVDNPNRQLPHALDLIEKYGVVPESAFRVKFSNGRHYGYLKNSVFKAFAKLVEKTADPKTITLADLHKILSSPAAFGAVPPSEFDVQLGDETVHMTSTDSLSKEIHFEQSAWQGVTIRTRARFERGLQAIKAALRSGHSVPFGFPVVGEAFKSDPPGFFARAKDESSFKSVGGHAVLITDFVNHGSRPGTLPQAERDREHARPVSDLNYIVFKNSWGEFEPRSRMGKLLPLGMMAMDREYLWASVTQLSEEGLDLLLPKSVADEIFKGEYYDQR